MRLSTFKSFLHLLAAAPLVLAVSCGKKNGGDEKLFQLLSPETTGVNFVNTVPENDTLNQFLYHYIFNGAGVATGDINNDGLPDLVFTANEKPAVVYLNKGDFKFEDITAKSGIKTSGWMSGVTMADVNNDGWLDIYICKSGPESRNDDRRNYLFINNKNNTFSESSAAWGVNDPGNATNATFFDMDNDGDLDMYLGNHADRFFSEINVPFTRKLSMDVHNQQHLFRNDGGKFTDISEAAGVAAMGYALSVTAADFNRDGFTDLYVCNDYHIPDYYYVNNGNGTFTEAFESSFKHSSTNSMGSDVADYDNDGWLDLVTLDMLADEPRRFQLMGGPKDLDFFQVAIKNHYGYQYMHNTLQTNTGAGHFSDLGFLNGIARTDWSWSPLFADLDNDGLTDLFITNGYYRDVTNLDFMIYQRRKLEQTGKPATQKEILQMVPFEKLSNYAYKNDGDYKFENKAEEWGLDELTHSTGSAYADLNNDGQLDLIVCNQGDPVQIYRNTGKGNYLRIRCSGSGNQNAFGYGCKIVSVLNGQTHITEMQATHGYQSSSEPIIHLGLGKSDHFDELTIVWPGGAFQTLKNVKANQLLTLKSTDAAGHYEFPASKEFSFTDITEMCGLQFTHDEKDNPDFKREPLLPHRFTKLGPGIASGDVNGDGLADLLITNARESVGPKLFVQNSSGKYTLNASQPWSIMNDVDVLGALIFDCDNDGDQDIYLVAGGSEYEGPSDKYRHRIFKNDGKGKFTEAADAIPQINTSGSCITAADIDADGDLDLFVAGRLNPGKYPNLDIRSYLLRNDGGHFTDITSFIAPELAKAGMVCAAVFSDFNNDNKPDLVLAGEWMPVVFMRNTGDRFVVEGSAGTRDLPGWFNSILPVDIDNDGDLDFIAGNKGENSFVQTSMDNPLKIYWSDLDGNGIQDIWMTYMKQGKEYPLFQLDEMGKAYPKFISKKYTTYTDFSTKTADEIFGAENMAKNRLKASTFASLLLINNNGTFEIKELPRRAQSAPIYGMYAADVDGNGFDDIIAIGNSYSPRVTHGRDDAFNGFVLYNNAGQLTYSDGMQNGFLFSGDAKSLVATPDNDQMLRLVAAQNNGPAKVFKPRPQLKFIPARNNECRALAKLKNGKVREENVNYGSGYLSCSQPGVYADANVVSVTFISAAGVQRTVNR